MPSITPRLRRHGDGPDPRLRQLGSRTAGHPEYGHAKGIEVTTGPLGQGIGTAVGMALSEAMGRARFPGLMLALSRQTLPTLRETPADNLSARGAYTLRPARDRQLILIATGSEVEIAAAAAARLGAEGIRASVVSAPTFELFAAQPDAYRSAVLGTAPRIGIEAAVRQGWEMLLRPGDGFLGMTGFGASAPAAAQKTDLKGRG